MDFIWIKYGVLFSELVLIISFLGPEIALTPCHDTITFVISDEQTENAASVCGEGNPTISVGRGRSQQRDSLQVYDLQITVLPVNSQPPSVTTGKPFPITSSMLSL